MADPPDQPVNRSQEYGELLAFLRDTYAMRLKVLATVMGVNAGLIAAGALSPEGQAYIYLICGIGLLVTIAGFGFERRTVDFVDQLAGHGKDLEKALGFELLTKTWNRDGWRQRHYLGLIYSVLFATWLTFLLAAATAE